MVLRAGATHYQPIAWDEAFALIARELNALSSPNEAIFYTSGKAPNEVAFAYQLFARQFGTNNLPDCSNMCHEASGTALTNVLGFGKGTVKLEDFAKAQLIFVVGHNPGTNHPRMLTALQEAKRNGAKIVAVNPLPETGLIAFMNPQEPLGLLGKATPIADLFLQVRINGDVPLFKGILKALVEAEDRKPGSAIAWDYRPGQHCRSRGAARRRPRRVLGRNRTGVRNRAVADRDRRRVGADQRSHHCQLVPRSDAAPQRARATSRKCSTSCSCAGRWLSREPVRVASAGTRTCRAIARWACGSGRGQSSSTRWARRSVFSRRASTASIRRSRSRRCTTAARKCSSHWVEIFCWPFRTRRTPPRRCRGRT